MGEVEAIISKVFSPLFLFFKVGHISACHFQRLAHEELKIKLKKDGYLDKTNFLGIATEALPAAHQSILPDQPMRVTTNSAAQ